MNNQEHECLDGLLLNKELICKTKPVYKDKYASGLFTAKHFADIGKKLSSWIIPSRVESIPVITKAHRLYKIESLCSLFEDLLSVIALIPIIGTIPALTKVAFGALQCIIGLSLVASSAFFPSNSMAREVLFHSSRHVVHGLLNVLIGFMHAIPFGSWYLAPIVFSRSIPCNVSVYKNGQSHKFFGYKTVRDNSWRFLSGFDDSKSKEINSDDMPVIRKELKDKRERNSSAIEDCVSIQDTLCSI